MNEITKQLQQPLIGLNGLTGEDALKAEWGAVYSALLKAREYIQKDGSRHTWLDGVIGITESRKKIPIPDVYVHQEPSRSQELNSVELESPSLEVLVDIARTIGEQRYVSGGDSRDDWRTMSEWAVEFQAQYDANPDAGETYMEDVEEFAVAKATDSGWMVCEPVIQSMRSKELDRPSAG